MAISSSGDVLPVLELFSQKQPGNAKVLHLPGKKNCTGGKQGSLKETAFVSTPTFKVVENLITVLKHSPHACSGLETSNAANCKFAICRLLILMQEGNYKYPWNLLPDCTSGRAER
ncbi:hypothetical protein [Rufibacter ruber]|uniref:hypothetical protein n=1 Tax=Rufibacter ruber TaxID=1783499 RepID=UPI001290148E|nr:hypothetical protein [Rufibacter ruber]